MKKIILSFIIGMIFLSSCNKLDLFPLSEGSDANWYKDETELNMAVVYLYHQSFWNAYAPLDFYFHTDDYDRRVEPSDLLNGTVTGRSGVVTSAWDWCYKTISRANLVLANYQKVTNVPEEKMNMYAANARFARATQYAKLIFHWGDVPYYEGEIKIDEAFSMGRTNKNEVLEKIYADYDFAAQYLPKAYSASEYQLATKGAALAFKARIALYMGDYITARDAAKACIELEGYTLFPDYTTLFLAETKNSVETIFAVPYSVEQNVLWGAGVSRDVVTRTAGGYGSRSPSWELLCSYLCTDGLPIDESPLFDPHEPFKNRDPRCSATIVEFNRNWLGFTYTPHPDSLTVRNHKTGGTVANSDNRAVDTWAAFNGLVWAKHVDESWLDQKADNDNILMRYADVLLMYAEAKIELGEIDQTVLDAMNEVRARAYGVDKSEISAYPEITAKDPIALRKLVRLERRMEFANENALRYNDIIRWKLAEKVLNLPRYGMLDVEQLREKVVDKGLWFFPETPSIDEDGIADLKPMHDKGLIKLLINRSFDPAKHYLWPIPVSEIVINDHMKQNPGY